MKKYLFFTMAMFSLVIDIKAQNGSHKMGIYTNQFLGELIKGDLKLKSRLTTGFSYSRRITRNNSLEYVLQPGVGIKNIQPITKIQP